MAEIETGGLDEISDYAIKAIFDRMQPLMRQKLHRDGGISEITSKDGTVQIVSPFGPVVDLGASSGSLYVQSQFLEESADTVVLDGFPTTLHDLLLTYDATIDDNGLADYVALMRFEDDDSDLEHDYFWNLAPGNPQGTTAALTEASYSDEGVALGLIASYGHLNKFGTGTMWFPNYRHQQFLPGDILTADDISCHGHGEDALNSGGNGPVDTWTIGGWRQGAGPLTKITIRPFPVSAYPGWDTPASFLKGSRFTILGY